MCIYMYVYVCACMLSHFSHVWLLATLQTVTHQAPLSMRFSRQEHQSGLPCPLPGDLPDPGIKSVSLMAPALASGFFTTSTTWEARRCTYCQILVLHTYKALPKQWDCIMHILLHHDFSFHNTVWQFLQVNWYSFKFHIGWIIFMLWLWKFNNFPIDSDLLCF